MSSNPDNSTSIFNSTGPGGQYYYDEPTAKFNPTTAVVIISLIGGCFVLAFVSVILRKYIRGDAGLTTIRSSTTQSGSYNVKSKGLQKADVDALPLVHRQDLDEKDTPCECPVCLTDFEPEDTLRLLPTCKHVFHRECIDAWFDTHSTCPLCRASLVRQPAGETKLSNLDGEHVAAVGGPGDPVVTTTEVLESGDSVIETRQTTSSDAPLQDPRTAIMTTRESSARGALFRNSESFKRVATGSDQQSSTKTSSFRKPPASSSENRRSSSLSADLIALRNLLTRQSDHNVDAPSRRWFSRARSLDLAQRGHAQGDEWVTIDLETGKAANNSEAQVPSSSSLSSKGESSKGPPERAWSDRWSLANLKGAVIFPLTRSDIKPVSVKTSASMLQPDEVLTALHTNYVFALTKLATLGMIMGEQELEQIRTVVRKGAGRGTKPAMVGILLAECPSGVRDRLPVGYGWIDVEFGNQACEQLKEHDSFLWC